MIEATFAVEIYRAAKKELEWYKKKRFPNGRAVRIERAGNWWIGMVSNCDECPEDKVSVLVESGNIWFYDLEIVEPCKMPRKKWPPPILKSVQEFERLKKASQSNSSAVK